MKIGYCYIGEDGLYRVAIDKQLVDELVKVTERHAKNAVKGDRYDAATEALAVRTDLTKLLEKADEKKDLDEILTE